MKYLIVFLSSLILFSACGGGSSSTNNEESFTDTEKPIITLNGDDKIVLVLGEVYQELGATATDNKDGNLTNSIAINSNIDYNVSGTYEITYSVKDSARNIATVIREIKIGDFIASPKSRIGLNINEVLVENVNTNLDPDFWQFSDWIELYNNSNSPIAIGGYYLSDKEENLTKWKFPDGTQIEANSYLVIWADNENIGLHTNFKLKSDGEKVILTDRNINIVDSIIYGKQKSDISFTRIENKIYHMKPTPASKNIDAYEILTRSKKPDFSQDQGFFNSAQVIKLVQENGGNVYYTVDGSIPTQNSTLYSQPINIDKTTVIKAISKENGKLLSKVRSKTYFINFDTTLPVVSLSTNSDYLYDDMFGIYVSGVNGIASKGCSMHLNDAPADYKNFNQEWDRPVYIEYFDEDKKRSFNLAADISITGQCSRYTPNNKKSFSIELDSKYGTKSLKYPLYPSKESVTKVKDFKFRMGQGGFNPTDILSVEIAEDGKFDVEYQAYKTVQIFINGEYWGIYSIREKKGEEHLKSNYPDIDSVDIIAHTVGGDIAKAGNLEAFNILNTYVDEHDLANASNYQELLRMIDENNFIDYMVLMIYSANEDWIYNNTRFWREKKEGAKWRWMLDDLDSAYATPTYDNSRLKTSNTLLSKLYKGLMLNNTFKSKFKDRFSVHLNTTFTTENMLQLINKISNERSQYMDLEVDKWGISQSTFDDFIQIMSDFVEDRKEYMNSELNQL